MFYILRGHEHEYEVQTIIQVFCPNGRYQRRDEPESGFGVESYMEGARCVAVIYEDGSIVASDECVIRFSGDKGEQQAVKAAIYGAFLRLGYGMQPWGILTGIRPAKIVHDLRRQGHDEKVKTVLLDEYLMSPEKAELCITVARAEEGVLDRIPKDGVALYVGIPFCPTRCLYCSFTSFPAERYTKKFGEYFGAVETELAAAKDYINSRKLNSVYVGGGTPTSIPGEYLERLLAYLRENFTIHDDTEFTVEAGRPDTVTAEKLWIMARYGVNRLSINPQTMNARTLEKIGRKHTPEDVIRAFGLAREAGFDNINADLIVGLPGENVSDVRNTFDQIEKLTPESVTVHTLCVKRASELNRRLDEYGLADAAKTEAMLGAARERCETMGLLPYYMYRQKNMLGNFENVGYCRPGRECAYNVMMMAERHDAIGAGAGAATKLMKEKGRIARVFGPKGVEEYIRRVGGVIQKKAEEGLL